MNISDGKRRLSNNMCDLSASFGPFVTTRVSRTVARGSMKLNGTVPILHRKASQVRLDEERSDELITLLILAKIAHAHASV